MRFCAARSCWKSFTPKYIYVIWLQVYDVDGDGLLTEEDLRSMLSYLVGGQLSEEQLREIISKCQEEAGTGTGISFETFQRFSDVSNFHVSVPTRM
jgi:Ca2+-binding EF-hand superfamily protein